MSRLRKVSLVVAGYVLAFVVACVVVRLWVATVPADAQTSQGMMAFSESILFLFTFSAGSVAPTGAILYFLRPHLFFWRAISLGALSVATTTAVLTLLDAFLAWAPSWSPFIGSMSVFTPLRTLLAPPLCLGLVLTAIFAPARSARTLLLVAAGAEVVLFVGVVYTWTHPPG